MNVLKYILVFVSAICGLVVAFVTGPMSRIDSTIAVNDLYIQALQKQYIYSSFLAALSACAVAYLTKANLKIVTPIIFVAGILWVLYTQSGDTEFLPLIAGALTEFMVPYSIITIVVMAAFIGINKKWPRLT